jgi:hypothetical protein
MVVSTMERKNRDFFYQVTLVVEPLVTLKIDVKSQF